MKKEDLIIKWLNNEQLTKYESEAFNKLDTSDSYVKISETAKLFKAPDYIPEENIQHLKDTLQTNSAIPLNNTNYIKIIMKIAAVFVAGIGIYFSFFKEYDTHITTIASKKTTIELPDNSIIKLNSVSSISYNKDDWEKKRKINLEGEAFFEVAKGKKFDVHTSSGIISVIGTSFNIKQRDEYLEVTCYTGIVSVAYNNNQVEYLKAGKQLEIYKNGIVKNKTSTLNKPQWFDNRSLFNATPYEKVLQELEWQYGVTITTKNIDKSTLFTGNFVHSNIETALKSITIPMRLQYLINNKNITLSRE